MQTRDLVLVLASPVPVLTASLRSLRLVVVVVVVVVVEVVGAAVVVLGEAHATQLR